MVTPTAAQTSRDSSPREDKFRSQLWELYFKFLDRQTAEKIWWQLLTPEERIRLGSWEEAYRVRGRGVSIYARAKNLSLEAAIVQLSHYFGFPEIDYLYHCQELFHFTGERIGPLETGTTPRVNSTVTDIPAWDSDRNELWFQGQIVRKYRGRTIATRVHCILDVFHEESWPSRIDDPLPNGPDSGRLRSAIAKLNEGLSDIRFFADGSGEGILWEPFNHSNITEYQISESI